MKLFKTLSGAILLGTLSISVSGKENIAAQAKLTATSEHKTYTAQKLIDGKKTRKSRWISEKGDNTPNVVLEWDAPQTIDQVKVYTGLGDNDSKWFVKKFQLEVFNDGEWKNVARVKRNRKKCNDLTFDSITTNKLRFSTRSQDTSQGMCRVLEIEVFSADK